MNAITVIKRPSFANSGRTYIVGQRSWIAPHLFDELKNRGRKPEYLMKAEVGDERLDGATMFLIAGVARPTREDMDREEELCERAAETGARIIYLSSTAIDEWEAKSRVLSQDGELYILGKKRCEQVICGARGYAVRAPVIFGPGQRLESDQLLPTIINRYLNGGGPLHLNDPFRPFMMVYVKDVAAALCQVAESDPTPVTSIYSDPDITPIELVNLASPGWSVYIPPRWTLHPRNKTKDLRGRDETYIHHIARMTIPFKEADVISTVAWYNEERSELIGPDVLLLE